MNGIAGQDLDWFFEVYFRSAGMPDLSSTQDGTDVVLRWVTKDDLPFDMPVPVRMNGSIDRIEFSDNMARLSDTQLDDILIDPNMQILRKLSSLPTCEEQRAEKKDDPK